MAAVPRVKYQVFISSTYGDLHEERQGVTWEILKARHIPAGMENFTATDDRGWKIIQRTIDDSDYYVLVVAGCYGSIDPTTGISWTESEYDYARGKGIPVLAFVREKAHITGNKIDTGDKAVKLAAFVARLQETHLYTRWTSPEDLNAKVASALRRAIDDDADDDTPRAGWIRGDVNPRNVAEEMARLSKENAELRASAADLDATKPCLEVLWDGEAPTDRVLQQPRLIVSDQQGRRHQLAGFLESSRSLSEHAEYWTRALWLPLQVRNSGTAVARGVKAQFSFKGVDELEFDRVHLDRLIPKQWWSDPTRSVHLDRHRAGDGKGEADQRIRSIGIDQAEALVRMALLAPEDALPGGVFEFQVSYVVTEESGTRAEGSFKVQVVLGEERAVTEDELKAL